MDNLVFWQERRAPRHLRRIPARFTRPLWRPERNFGDLLAPMVVAGALELHGWPRTPGPSRRLLSIGSILHLAGPSDVVWGTGKNERVPDDCHRLAALDVRAVRGPLTRRWLEERDVECPEVFGDPALLLPRFREDLVELSSAKRHGVTFVSHIDDGFTLRRPGIRWVLPSDDVESVLRTIVTSRLVIATSLHAVIVAEAFGVPARSIVNRCEPEFKFADYYLSTGRPSYRRARSISEALALGGESGPDIDLGPLLAAFPLDLFEQATTPDGIDVAG